MEKIKVKRIFLANAIEVAGAACTALYPNIPRFSTITLTGWFLKI